ncbi:MAG: PLP-dependent aminotransferase family protein [Rhodospirillum sp.]|nr:PLP-dependent aminotransferase family protein [Rhodospirillum sp.]MCF8487722.1 PLP-dependent aminotransferase family protein [Rhodospirillum sp.]MCF8500400.1 PLP-dependent aminotransferase family protein [Rhodospirillum sp.]
MSLPPLPKDLPLARSVADGLRERILRGLLTPGTRLPSSRRLAGDLGLSRTTALTAYESLKAEGYVTSRTGSGHFVAEDLPHLLPHPLPLPSVVTPETEISSTGKDPRGEASLRLSNWGTRAVAHAALRLPAGQAGQPRARYDFLFGLSLTDAFPHAAWKRAIKAVLDARWRRPDLLRYQPPEGASTLRTAVAQWLRDHRGITPEGRDVLITNGSQQGIELALRLLVNPGERVAVEDPGYGGFREVLGALGAEAVPLPVDDQGPRVDLLPGLDPPIRGVCVTPSHQFPTGVVLSLSRRMDLLRWARETNSWILEDDYDSEFRYGDRPLPALAGADLEGRVIYLAGFSKALFPSLRLGFVSAPQSLFPAFIRAREVVDRHGPGLEQEALALWMSDGTFGRHLRRVRTLQAARREILVTALRESFGNRIRITGAEAGIHLVAWFPEHDQASMALWSERARSKDVRALPLGHQFVTPDPPAGFILGYAGIEREDIAEGIRQLASVEPPPPVRELAVSGRGTGSAAGP